MISGSRSILQASVDERAEVISRLISATPVLIHAKFEEYDQNARKVAVKNCDGDDEVYSTIYANKLSASHPDDEEWMILEFYGSMVMLICSFAESTIRDLLPDPKPSFSSNFLCNAYNYLNKVLSLNLKSIGNYWKGHQDFTQKRNDIAHNRRVVDVSEKELYDAIDGVHTLLRVIADALDTKNG